MLLLQANRIMGHELLVVGSALCAWCHVAKVDCARHGVVVTVKYQNKYKNGIQRMQEIKTGKVNGDGGG